jgi:uncharacterized protein with NRDE domain
MCLILIAHQTSAQRPLLVLSNRDEFYARPTSAAGPWDECPEIIAGRDLVSGGTWFGARGTRWASVTNIREGLKHSHSHRSRGWLVRDYLLGNQAPRDFLTDLAEDSGEYAGFNLLLGNQDQLWYGNNRGISGYQLQPGIYGLSNHQLDTPWPKVLRGKQGLADLLIRPRLDHDRAFAILADTTRAPDAQLPETGVPLDWERSLSAAFIVRDNYGTRSSTLFAIEDDGQHHFIERRFERTPELWQQTEFAW